MLVSGLAAPICRACGSKGPFASLPYVNELYDGGEASLFDGLSLSCCQDCGFSWTTPRLHDEALERFYRTVYRSADRGRHAHQLEDVSQLSKYGRLALAQIQLARTFWSPSRPDIDVLDIGAGQGAFLAAARAIFPRAVLHAVEPDEHSHDLLRAMGASLLGETFPLEAVSEGKKFDLIACSHVIEHLNADALDGFLSALAAILKPGGIALIEVPHANFKKYPDYRPNDAPHLCFFSETALTRLLAGHFRVIYSGSCGSPYPTNNPLATAIASNPKQPWRTRVVKSLLGSRIPGISLPLKLWRKLRSPDVGHVLQDESYSYGADRVFLRAVVSPKI